MSPHILTVELDCTCIIIELLGPILLIQTINLLYSHRTTTLEKCKRSNRQLLWTYRRETCYMCASHRCPVRLVTTLDLGADAPVRRGGGGGASPCCALSSKSLPMTSPREDPTCRAISWPPLQPKEQKHGHSSGWHSVINKARRRCRCARHMHCT